METYEERHTPAPQHEQEPPMPRERQASSRTATRPAAVAVIVAAAALVIWLVARDHGNSSPSEQAAKATAVTPAALARLAASVGHPVFWLGPRAGTTYELSQTTNGSIYVRYLPAGVRVGTKTPYLTVATYPFAGAYAAIETVSRQKGATRLRLANGGIGEVSSKAPQSVHIAYPSVDYQVEVYDPTPGEATALVAAGKVAYFGTLRQASGAPQASAVTPARLRALAKKLGHPIYWVGPKAGYTYELKQTSAGLVYIRYLPPGTPVGAAGQFLTVGTYPYPGAFAATKALAKESGQVKVAVPGGGVGASSTADPKSIHLAFPGDSVQVEVFDPSPSTARHVVGSGQVRTVG
jgi:hypothetical protein